MHHMPQADVCPCPTRISLMNFPFQITLPRGIAGILFLLLTPVASAADEGEGLIAAVEREGARLEARIGFAAYDLQSGQRWEYRADQRFPIASTFKTLACGALLSRVDAGQAQLDTPVHFTAADLVTY